jgi:hypothetical protein
MPNKMKKKEARMNLLLISQNIGWVGGKACALLPTGAEWGQPGTGQRSEGSVGVRQRGC